MVKIYFPLSISNHFFFTIKLAQRNTLFLKRPVSDILSRLDSIENLKTLCISTANLYIPEYIPYLKIYVSCFPTIICPKYGIMWKMKRWFLHCGSIILTMCFFYIIFYLHRLFYFVKISH